MIKITFFLLRSAGGTWRSELRRENNCMDDDDVIVEIINFLRDFRIIGLRVRNLKLETPKQ